MPKTANTGAERASYAPKEVAARNNFSLSYIYEEIASARLRAFKSGGHGPFRVTPDAERAWLEGSGNE
jgi:hypothetical protein